MAKTVFPQASTRPALGGKLPKPKAPAMAKVTPPDQTSIKSYAGSKDKNAGAITPAMTQAARRKNTPVAMPHPGEYDLPTMHTSKHN